MGYVPIKKAGIMERRLRMAKVDTRDSRVPYLSEVFCSLFSIRISIQIALVHRSQDPKNIITQFPGIYILTDPARLIRPVTNLATETDEYIGTYEQVYLSVIIDPNEADPGVTMHQEKHPSALFSFAGNLIPFPDHNQSPRFVLNVIFRSLKDSSNVYQCQMGKQTMGTAVHAWHARADNKMYRLQVFLYCLPHKT